jgi:hypothetical protein
MFWHGNFCVRRRPLARITEKQTAEFRAQTSPIKSGLCRKKLRKRNIGSNCDSGISANDTTANLHKEASELLAIFSAIGKRLKQ